METRRNRIGNSCLVLFHVARKGEIGGIIRKSVIFSGGEEYLLGILFYGTGGIFEQEIRGIFQCVCGTRWLTLNFLIHGEFHS